MFKDGVWKAITGDVLPDDGGYDLSSGEMNPAIYERFACDLEAAGFKTAWEPFSMAKSNGYPYFRRYGIKLIAYSMKWGEHVIVMDSTVFGPGEVVGGVIFHPPYYGSALLSDDPRDLSAIRDLDTYEKAVGRAAELARQWISRDGLVAAVSRVYRYGGRQIRLDRLMRRLFDKDMMLQATWISTPDVVQVFRRL